MNGERLRQAASRVETFTRYRLLHGHVLDVSCNTVTGYQRKPDDGGRQPPNDKNGRPQSGSPAHVARVQLDKARRWSMASNARSGRAWR